MSAISRWVDSHCHLQLGDEEAAEAVAGAVAAGVERMICVGTDLETSRQAIGLAARHPEVWATVGLHPHDASRLPAEWDDLVRLARDSDRVVGVGECGFDLHYRHSEPDEQEAAFRAQIRLAHELDTTLVIHTREAWDETFAVLASEGVPARTVFHCFTGGPDQAVAALELGAWLSFSGIVSFPRAPEVRAAAALTPPDRLLVETDSPYLAPVPHRGKRNVPGYLPAVGAAVAEARGETVEQVAASTRAAALAAFWPAG
jgi:TatD DNase family protein